MEYVVSPYRHAPFELNGKCSLKMNLNNKFRYEVICKLFIYRLSEAPDTDILISY